MTELLCDSRYHYEPCDAEHAEDCQNGPSWHWTIPGQGGGHCVEPCTELTHATRAKTHDTEH